MTLPRIITESLGGGPLARRLIAGDAPTPWYLPRPTSPETWRGRAEDVRASAQSSWLSSLVTAFAATGAARERLERVANGQGVVVTTGQQPGLFGGPIYTWSKALSALELANAIERDTGIPAAPVFWAATDDADFAEASDTWVALVGGEEHLTTAIDAIDALPMHDHPLGDVSHALERLATAAGSAVEPGILDAVRVAYHPKATVGGAYLTLMRQLLQPLGIAVLDASHPALLAAERPWLERALVRSREVEGALLARSAEIRSAGFEPQVADVEGLSLVFGREAGRKIRIPLRLAEHAAADRAAPLSPNVLLRPVVERAVLPTVAYVAGPGEIAYFAQVGAVAPVLGAATPLVVPRWSCTIVEPHVAALLAARGIERHDVANPDALETSLARRAAPAPVMTALQALRDRIDHETSALARVLSDEGSLLPPSVTDGLRHQMTWRAERLERRLIAALKRRDDAMRRDVATLRGALHPGGMRQERALNLLPIVARHGHGVVEAMRMAARRHAEALVHGRPLPVDTA
ncbi:MAG: bacillithiol biosynthesis BshC [Gemmatimonadaceae bacterium]|nr:bacillithiol biosynthesis BshC [Gemmatimonadaceae bacterium]